MFPRELATNETQTATSRFWIRVASFISFKVTDVVVLYVSHYATGSLISFRSKITVTLSALLCARILFCRRNIIIIIMSHRQHGYPWLSLATSPYHSSPPAGLQGYILCPHIVAVCRFVLVVLLLHIHMCGSTGVHRLWARPTCLVRLTCIVFVMGGKCPYSWCLVGCCHQDLFNTALNILV